LGADPTPLARRLSQDEETDVSARRALILSLEDLNDDRLPAPERQQLVAKLLETYKTDKDSGIHSAAEWLLRKWDVKDKLKEADDQLRDKGEETDGSWYVNPEGHTM